MSAKPLAIAHRGASARRPENTLAAFIEAVAMGADAVELDVQLSRDGRLVVIHDETLERTTNGAGIVEEHDFEQLRTLDAGAWFGDGSIHDRVPTLEEVLDAVAGRVLVNVELKPSQRVEGLVTAALAAVEERGLLTRVVFSSFRADALRLLRARSAHAAIGVLCTAGTLEPSLAEAGRLGARNLHPWNIMVDRELVGVARARGLAVWPWTANETDEIERLVALGVDGIFSDHPDRVQAARAA